MKPAPEPLSPQGVLLLFGIPGLAALAGMQWLFPALVGAGVEPHIATFLMVWSGLLAVFAAVLVAEARKGNRPHTLFRIGSLSSGWWSVLVLVFLGLQMAEATLSGTGTWLAQIPGMGAPAHMPDLFRPGYHATLPLESFLGVPVAGRWDLLAFWAVWLVVNIGCEELLWRGYVLPRMEPTFGRWAWLVNGLCWAVIFHAFMRWNLLAILPSSLLIPYLCQRTGSIWPGVFLHGIGNLLVFGLLLPTLLVS